MVVANHIAGQIERGERAVGSRLPSELDLSNMWGVARMTTRRAIRELSERGLVPAVHGKGTFVTQPDAWARAGSRLAGAIPECHSGIGGPGTPLSVAEDA
ncbi:GntR family transcriptional regulator [Nonomuraea diastatica]|uniref:GntR family transcriptional regulator n=1 Tax=Nonomuraea diastatica TaxID=1848329 RepID=A0A4R4X1Z9_9ACTN|nr:GntR family transcriptional regulator [Nonomuraea diastatica]TDD24223.1 GntR family transcriptional regulator [Nonomuraea diastatica]